MNVIKNAKVKIKWPNTVNIEIQERNKIAYIESDNAYYPVMENGKVLKDRKVAEIPVNAPILLNLKKVHSLKKWYLN